jgi:hypothetical protein
MPTLRTRASKGTDLTPTEADTNFKRTVSAKTTTYSCLVGDNRSQIECNSATPFTVTLGDAATMAAAETGDYEVTVSNIGSGAVTVARAGSNTIDGGSTSLTIEQYNSVTLKVNAAGTGYNSISKGFGSVTSTSSEINGLHSLTASRAIVTTASGILTPATTTAAEIGYLSGATSAIQTQITAKAAKGANSDITSLAGLTTPLTAGQGGTGYTTFAAALTASPVKETQIDWANGAGITQGTCDITLANSGADTVWTGDDVLASLYVYIPPTATTITFRFHAKDQVGGGYSSAQRVHHTTVGYSSPTVSTSVTSYTWIATDSALTISAISGWHVFYVQSQANGGAHTAGGGADRVTWVIT